MNAASIAAGRLTDAAEQHSANTGDDHVGADLYLVVYHLLNHMTNEQAQRALEAMQEDGDLEVVEFEQALKKCRRLTYGPIPVETPPGST